ncbi:MAG: hypothetical protein M0R73_03515 [Dehalococcoidia bacterium]|nr:hypothetical protein [Dehalococcoidia bacterium]
MALQVFRCSHCGREVLVRAAGPLSEHEVRRRIREEMQPDAAGPPARPQWPDRLRDDIWVGVSGHRTHIPRASAPDDCPSCGRPALTLDRVIEPD